MPQYNKAPLPYKPVPTLAVAGKPEYVLGSHDDKSSSTQGNVISNSASGTTATLTFQILAGNAPANGNLITVIGCANSVNFNITNVALLSAVTNVLSGVCTVTYTISSTSQATLTDGGQVVIPRPEVGETPVTGASVPIAVAAINSLIDQGRVVTCDVTFPITTGMSGTFQLQGAMIDNDTDYELVATVPVSVVIASGSVSTAGPMVSDSDTSNYRYYRISEGSVTAGSGTVVGKILI